MVMHEIIISLVRSLYLCEKDVIEPIGVISHFAEHLYRVGRVQAGLKSINQGHACPLDGIFLKQMNITFFLSFCVLLTISLARPSCLIDSSMVRCRTIRASSVHAASYLVLSPLNSRIIYRTQTLRRLKNIYCVVNPSQQPWLTLTSLAHTPCMYGVTQIGLQSHLP